MAAHDTTATAKREKRSTPVSGARILSVWLCELCAFFFLMTSNQPVMAQEVILFDRFDFVGPSLRLTDSAPDLDAFGFDNDVESIRVVSGVWSFHRDDNFQNVNGPPLQLGPGFYPNIELLGFPEDRMSSVRLVEAGAPPPDCPAPYQAVGSNGQCVFTCGAGTVPDQGTGECKCARGMRETGQDASGRRICSLDTANPPVGGVIPGNPNVIRPPTQPNLGALPHLPVDPNVTLLPPGQIQTIDVPAQLAFSIARRNGFGFAVEPRGNAPQIRCRMQADRPGIDLTVRYQGAIGGFDFGLIKFNSNCVYRMFGSQPLAPGWVATGQARVVSLNQCARDHGRVLTGEQSDGGGLGSPTVVGNPFPEAPRLLIQAQVNLNNNVCTDFRWRVETIRLKGPAGVDWRQAFQPQ